MCFSKSWSDFLYFHRFHILNARIMCKMDLVDLGRSTLGVQSLEIKLSEAGGYTCEICNVLACRSANITLNIEGEWL